MPEGRLLKLSARGGHYISPNTRCLLKTSMEEGKV